MLRVEPPNSKIQKEAVFENDVTATAALYGIYHDLIGNAGFASGNELSVTSLASLSSDELLSYQPGTAEDFAQNALTAENSYVFSLWSSMYNIIYQCNSVLEGLSSSTLVTENTKKQIAGEALFIRSFAYLYLVNFFGDVPLATTTNYSINATLPRTAKFTIYNNIVNDLSEAKSLLREEYPSIDDDFVTPARYRPNKFAAAALLARVYLYLGEWAKAEAESSLLIDNKITYQLNNLNEVFLKNSSEAIWQLKPVQPEINTIEAITFIIDVFPQYYYLSNEFVASFEPNDNRKTFWIGSFDYGSELFYFPFKYKVKQSYDLLEYSMVLRLAEQFLIRAEAKAHQHKLSEAIGDLDTVRQRAGIPLISVISPGWDENQILAAIQQERKVELFCEWGHRWLDLKRTGNSTSELSLLKPDWTANDTLYPIPQNEFDKNPAIKNQNVGY